MRSGYTYRFITIWKVKAPIEAVWKVIHDQEQWPDWWKGVVKVETLQQGDANNIGKVMRYTWKSLLPYTLAFDMRADEIQRPHLLSGTAFGELEGKGRWELQQEDDITTLIYHWDVNTTKPWMNKLSWLLKPAFKWNHDIVMRWGAEGLAKRLNAPLILSENKFRE